MSVIYIASPYSVGDQAANVRVQIEAMHRILDMGHAPIAPLLAHFADQHRPRPYEDWVRMCLELVPRADVLLRLPGESAGADREVAVADRTNIAVCMGWDDLTAWHKLLGHRKTK